MKVTNSLLGQGAVVLRMGNLKPKDDLLQTAPDRSGRVLFCPMNRRLLTILLVSQFLIDVAIAFNFWIGSMWQTKVTELLRGQGLL